MMKTLKTFMESERKLETNNIYYILSIILFGFGVTYLMTNINASFIVYSDIKHPMLIVLYTIMVGMVGMHYVDVLFEMLIGINKIKRGYGEISNEDKTIRNKVLIAFVLYLFTFFIQFLAVTIANKVDLSDSGLGIFILIYLGIGLGFPFLLNLLYNDAKKIYNRRKEEKERVIEKKEERIKETKQFYKRNVIGYNNPFQDLTNEIKSKISYLDNKSGLLDYENQHVFEQIKNEELNRVINEYVELNDKNKTSYKGKVEISLQMLNKKLSEMIKEVESKQVNKLEKTIELFEERYR